MLSSSPATRTIVNSSRFVAEIDRKCTRSSSGLRGEAASSSTRSLKASHESSRLRSRSSCCTATCFLLDLRAMPCLTMVEESRFPFLIQLYALRNGMKTLYLLRHAKAEPGGPELTDTARPLSARGREACPRMGAYMRRCGYDPALVLCSASHRTRETWER